MYKVKLIPYKFGVIYLLLILDIAGQERFGSLTQAYYRGAVGALLVFDSTDPGFENVIKWKEDIDKKVQLRNDNPIPCILIANKSDLTQIDEKELERFCIENNFMKWYSSSAKENVNVEDPFLELTKKAIENETLILPQDTYTIDTSEQVIQPSNHQPNNKSSCAC